MPNRHDDPQQDKEIPMTTATTPALFETGKAALDLSRRCTLKMVEGIPQDKLCHQPVPGGKHVLWVLGHLACTDDFFATTLGGRESVLDEKWNELFGMGSTPTDDPSAYPTLEEIRTRLGRARQAMLETFQSMDEEKLRSPTPDEWKEFAPTHAAAMASVAFHEGFHAGQLSAVRRSLGLPNALGM
jgi:uncharacterized damage-inducible protein DinB